MPSYTFAPIVRCQSLLRRFEPCWFEPRRSQPRARAATAAALLALGLALSGCASSVGELGDNMTEAFADPAKYEFFDCKQLQTERKGINTHIDEIKRLMAKAETGVGGPVVAEMVYRQDYIAYQGQLKFVDKNWRRNNCVEVPETASAPAAPVVLSGKGKGKGKGQGPGQSGTAQRSG